MRVIMCNVIECEIMRVNKDVSERERELGHVRVKVNVGE